MNHPPLRKRRSGWERFRSKFQLIRSLRRASQPGPGPLQLAPADVRGRVESNPHQQRPQFNRSVSTNIATSIPTARNATHDHDRRNVPRSASHGLVRSRQQATHEKEQVSMPILGFKDFKEFELMKPRRLSEFNMKTMEAAWNQSQENDPGWRWSKIGINPPRELDHRVPEQDNSVREAAVVSQGSAEVPVVMDLRDTSSGVSKANDLPAMPVNEASTQNRNTDYYRSLDLPECPGPRDLDRTRLDRTMPRKSAIPKPLNYQKFNTGKGPSITTSTPSQAPTRPVTSQRNSRTQSGLNSHPQYVQILPESHRQCQDPLVYGTRDPNPRTSASSKTSRGRRKSKGQSKRSVQDLVLTELETITELPSPVSDGQKPQPSIDVALGRERKRSMERARGARQGDEKIQKDKGAQIETAKKVKSVQARPILIKHGRSTPCPPTAPTTQEPQMQEVKRKNVNTLLPTIVVPPPKVEDDPSQERASTTQCGVESMTKEHLLDFDFNFDELQDNSFKHGSPRGVSFPPYYSPLKPMALHPAPSTGPRSTTRNVESEATSTTYDSDDSNAETLCDNPDETETWSTDTSISCSPPMGEELGKKEEGEIIETVVRGREKHHPVKTNMTVRSIRVNKRSKKSAAPAAPAAQTPPHAASPAQSRYTSPTVSHVTPTDYPLRQDTGQILANKLAWEEKQQEAKRQVELRRQSEMLRKGSRLKRETWA